MNRHIFLLILLRMLGFYFISFCFLVILWWLNIGWSQNIFNISAVFNFQDFLSRDALIFFVASAPFLIPIFFILILEYRLTKAGQVMNFKTLTKCFLWLMAFVVLALGGSYVLRFFSELFLFAWHYILYYSILIVIFGMMMGVIVSLEVRFPGLKKIILPTIMVLFMMLFGIIYATGEGHCPTNDLDCLAEYFSDEAKETNDYRICDRLLPRSDIRDDCISRFAFGSQDLKYCEMIETNNPKRIKDYCYEDLCRVLGDPYYDSDCAKRLQTCEKITDPDVQQSCFGNYFNQR